MSEDIQNTIDRLKKHKDVLFNVLVELRTAQKNYMKDRGNQELGKLVGKASAKADNVLQQVIKDDSSTRDL
jgi:hypothetical protein